MVGETHIRNARCGCFQNHSLLSSVSGIDNARRPNVPATLSYDVSRSTENCWGMRIPAFLKKQIRLQHSMTHTWYVVRLFPGRGLYSLALRPFNNSSSILYSTRYYSTVLVFITRLAVFFCFASVPTKQMPDDKRTSEIFRQPKLGRGSNGRKLRVSRLLRRPE